MQGQKTQGRKTQARATQGRMTQGRTMRGRAMRGKAPSGTGRFRLTMRRSTGKGHRGRAPASGMGRLLGALSGRR